MLASAAMYVHVAIFIRVLAWLGEVHQHKLPALSALPSQTEMKILKLGTQVVARDPDLTFSMDCIQVRRNP